MYVWTEPAKLVLQRRAPLPEQHFFFFWRYAKFVPKFFELLTTRNSWLLALVLQLLSNFV